MVCDKNFAVSGDHLVVSGYIDQTQGKNDIESAYIVLEEKRILIAEDNTVEDENISLEKLDLYVLEK